MKRVMAKVEGDLLALLKQEVEAGEVAVTRGVTSAGLRLKQVWREQITGAGLGARLSRTIRSEVYPKGRASLSAAALVWTKAPQIIDAHDKGALISSSNGFWLAIPLPAAGVSARRGRITPGEWERRHGMRLRFVYRRGKSALLVVDDARTTKKGLARPKRGKRRADGILRGSTTVPIFILVPQVRLKKRLNLDAAAQAAVASVPSAIVANWRSQR